MIAFPPFRGIVRFFVISCFAVFLGQMLFARFLPSDVPGVDGITSLFGLIPSKVLEGHFYQLFTWVFLHSTQMIFHILFNMLAFWMFGSLIEEELGSRRFIVFCLLGSLFSGLAVVGSSFFNQELFLTPTIGASGLVFAVVIAFARLYPNQTVIFYIFPMKMKYLAGMLVLVDLFFLVTGDDKRISYVAHLAGALYGFLFIGFMLNRGNGGQFFKQWKEQLSAKRKKRHLRIVYPEQPDERRTYH